MKPEQSPQPYWCVVCGRPVEPMIIGDAAIYVHDDIPHPAAMTFDEEAKPQ